jgi:hypothetical protein
MQTKQLEHRTVEIPATFVASIARFLRRCEAHEAERSRGRVTFPQVVTVELSEHARMWASYLDSLLEPLPDAPNPSENLPERDVPGTAESAGGERGHASPSAAMREHLRAIAPAAAGVEEVLAGPGGEEGARVLADEATEQLSRQGFTPRQIRLWAEAYIATNGSGNVEGLLDWIARQEARAERTGLAGRSSRDTRRMTAQSL